MTVTFFSGKDIIEIRPDQLDALKDAARQSPLRRARLCLHHSHDDPVQEMVIAFSRGTYIRPHRHRNKSESFHVVEGELDVVFFDDAGSVTRRVRMGRSRTGEALLYRLATPLWHMVVPRSELVVIHEVTTGPFVQDGNEYADWAPEDDDAEGIRSFLARFTAGAA